MKIQSVAVLGAGAVGSYVIWGLSERKDIKLGVIAEGERAGRLKKGCKINDVTYHPEVWTPQEAHGVDLLIVCLKYGALPGASAKFSTLQDIEAGRHTEIDMFSGALMRMGKELGIPTPYNEYTYHMIKALEEKNDGKFDYRGKNDKMTWSR
ncbi:MAG: hypothetical protein MSA59_10020 [Lachnobacterium sp.]|nr:hypothetical protein [Lachnobacterium sp.]